MLRFAAPSLRPPLAHPVSSAFLNGRSFATPLFCVRHHSFPASPSSVPFLRPGAGSLLPRLVSRPPANSVRSQLSRGRVCARYNSSGTRSGASDSAGGAAASEGPRQAAQAGWFQTAVFFALPVAIALAAYKKVDSMRQQYTEMTSNTPAVVPFDRILVYIFQGTCQSILNHPTVVSKLGMCEVDQTTVKMGLNEEGSWVAYPLLGETGLDGKRKVGTVLLELLPKKTEDAKPHQWVLLHIEIDFNDGEKFLLPINITYDMVDLYKKLSEQDTLMMESEKMRKLREKRIEYQRKKAIEEKMKQNPPTTS